MPGPEGLCCGWRAAPTGHSDTEGCVCPMKIPVGFVVDRETLRQVSSFFCHLTGALYSVFSLYTTDALNLGG